MVIGKKRTIFAVLNHEAGRGPARLRRLVWDQEIAGSNPAAPTTKAAHNVSGFFVRVSESSLSSEQQTKTTAGLRKQAAAFVESLPSPGS